MQDETTFLTVTESCMFQEEMHHDKINTAKNIKTVRSQSGHTRSKNTTQNIVLERTFSHLFKAFFRLGSENLRRLQLRLQSLYLQQVVVFQGVDISVVISLHNC